MTQARRETFHHGNLRSDLLDLASRRIEEVGYETLSMRELATSLGVAASAPYRHFANREELLRTLAHEELVKLSAAYRAASKADASPQARFRMACESYLSLASRKPQTFRLIFMNAGVFAPDREEGDWEGYEIFVELAMDAKGLTNRHEGELAAFAAWSTLHGFSILRLDPRAPDIARDEAAAETVLDRACAVQG